MTRTRRRWDPAPLPTPKRPYRDTAVFHLMLAALIVGVAFLTGGNLFRALVIAVAFFVAATAWSWSRWRKQLNGAQAGEPGRPGQRP